MIKTYMFLLIIFGTCVKIRCQTVKYSISGRGITGLWNLFFEVDKDRDHYCKSGSIYGNPNPEWGDKCEVTYSGDKNKIIKINLRNNVSWWPDDSIAWVIVYVKNLVENGKIIHEHIWSGSTYRGYLRISIEVLGMLDNINGGNNTLF